MSRFVVEHRSLYAQSLFASGKRAGSGDDPRINYLIDYMTTVRNGIVPDDTDVNLAADIYFNGTQSKIILESALIAGDATHKEIAEAVAARVAMVDAYAFLFFDMSVFNHHLDITDYLADTCEKSSQEWVTKCDAFKYGFYTVRESLKASSFNRDLKVALSSYIQTADNMIRQTRGQLVTSQEAKEGRAWMLCHANLLKTYHDIAKSDPTEDEFDFRRVLLQPRKEVSDIKELKGNVLM